MDDPLEQVKNIYTIFKYGSFGLLCLFFLLLYYLDSRIAECERPRGLTEEQRKILRLRLQSSDRPFLVVRTVSARGSEPHSYASQLAEFLRDEVSWNAGILGTVPDKTLSGVSVVAEAGNSASSALGLNLAAGLREAGIPASFREVDVHTLRTTEAGRGSLHLWVGHKFSRPLSLLDILRPGPCEKQPNGS